MVFLNLKCYKLGVLLCLGVLRHRLSEAVSFFYTDYKSPFCAEIP